MVVGGAVDARQLHSHDLDVLFRARQRIVHSCANGCDGRTTLQHQHFPRLAAEAWARDRESSLAQFHALATRGDRGAEAKSQAWTQLGAKRRMADQDMCRTVLRKNGWNRLKPALGLVTLCS